jgi:hypothetical protein
MATFKNYLTSIEPDMEQTIYSQSIGGFCSNSPLYPETTLLSTIGLYDITLTLNTPESGTWDDWQGIEYINIGNEVMQVSPIINGSITVITRGYNGIINMHISGENVRAVSSKELFNNVFNEDHKQYRCIAIKNVSSSEDPSGSLNAYNFEVYLKQNSRNDNSSIKIALEVPTSQYLSSTSTKWTSMQVVDTSLIGIYDDNYFQGAYLKILSGDASGQGKVVSSFDSSTGTFTFYSSFSSSYSYASNVLYEVLPAPAQRLKTGTDSPVDTGIDFLSFVSTSEDATLRFVSGSATNPMVGDLYPNDVVYVWIERTMEKGAESFNHNDIVLNIKYSVSE